jgi:uncharacterized membrane protein YfcA
MEIALGFLIALAVGLTGVGAGSVTAPALMILLHVPAAPAVGTALIFGAIIKFVAAPSYLWRKQVNFRILGWMLAGGLPGAIAGSLLLDHLKRSDHNTLLYGVLGVMIAVSAALNLWRLLVRSNPKNDRDRRRWLTWIALPIGAEVGFSSAGAGALGSLALMGLTTLTAAQVVGTDMFFGLGLSLAGGGIALQRRQLRRRLVVAIDRRRSVRSAARREFIGSDAVPSVAGRDFVVAGLARRRVVLAGNQHLAPLADREGSEHHGQVAIVASGVQDFVRFDRDLDRRAAGERRGKREVE